MSVFVEGLALSGYRGIGKDVQLLRPFKRFNFFIGPNNVGKSAVLAFIADRSRDGTTYTPSYHGGRQRRNFDAHLMFIKGEALDQ